MSLSGTAKETLAIIETGGYSAPSGAWVDIGAPVRQATSNTVLYRPDQLVPLVPDPAPASTSAPTVKVTAETTAEAGERLARAGHKVAALNFASARNPGGGFLNGAKAQEEDLARCSALYPCQLTQPAYYQANRSCTSLLYTDHIIYSPEVPFFRGRDLSLLDHPFTLSIITAPAPNAGEVRRSDQILECLRRRAAMVLAVAHRHGHRVVVLGAWGCGVFRNNPSQVAGVFRDWLHHPTFAQAFDEVVFAIRDRSKGQETLRAFAELSW